MHTKVIVTVGPSTSKEEDLRMIKSKGVDFIRVNLSHSTIEDLKYFIELSKKINLPFIIDTEGSQIRSGDMKGIKTQFKENNLIKVYSDPTIIGDESTMCLRPAQIVRQLERGDLIHIDFDNLILRVKDTSTYNLGYIVCRVMVGGEIGSNKAVVITSNAQRLFELPVLSQKDMEAINIGLKEGIGYIALSFARRGSDIDELRRITKESMRIISKIECVDALKNLDEIIEKSDYLLIDRGDLSKEIPIEKIPFIQKIIITKARRKNVGVFVATNLLETMVSKKNPSRAEVNDVINTIMDGVYGLALAAETAVGKHPMECINMINKLREQAESIDFIASSSDYISDITEPSLLVPPHGGKLVNRILTQRPELEYLNSLKKVKLNENQLMDVEQIAIGAFSPIEGFMCESDFNGVLDNMRLKSGIIWPLPIVLDVSLREASNFNTGDDIALTNKENDIVAILHLEEIYTFNIKETALKIFGTLDKNHPGVKMTMNMNPILLGGKIDLLKRANSKTKEYELTPRQVRRLFEEKNWVNVVGFHTRNVIHMGHEFIQLNAMERENCDGLFVHPVVGKKKPGDFSAEYIIKSYEIMMDKFYSRNKVVFAVFSTFSRYAGPREAIFTALCRKNFGCSHFIVGRDHTGVGDFYHPEASSEIFDKVGDLGIKIIKFGNIFYSKKLNKHIHEKDDTDHTDEDKYYISGTQIRRMLQDSLLPPDFMMRKEISAMLIDSISNKEEVFVREKDFRGVVVWFTGLSGSGKTTIALKLKEIMSDFGTQVEVLDGDVMRNSLTKNLGFTREDIRENNRIIAEFARQKSLEFDFILVPIISPYRSDRELARSIIGENFIELYVNSSLEKCIERDIKGLYKRAISGEINNLIGFSDLNPYEHPLNPDFEIKTDGFSIEECTQMFINFLKEKEYLQ